MVSPTGLTPRAARVLVRAGGRTVDTDFPDDLADRIRFGLHVGQQPIPRAVTPPAVEPIRAGLPGAIAFGKITLGRAGTQLPENAIDHCPVVAPLPTPLLMRGQQGLNDTPGVVGQLASAYHCATLLTGGLFRRIAHSTDSSDRP